MRTVTRRGKNAKVEPPDPASAPPTPRAGSSTPSTTATATETRASEAQAPPAAKKGRDPLLAGICHDLRAPLAAVTMGANFVLQTTPDDPSTARSRRVLSAILRSCKQMDRLVRDFADLSEIEADAVELRLGVHDTGELVEIAAEAARPDGAARNVSISVDRPGKSLPIHCDRERVLRALAHLLDNAIKFSPEGGEVALAVAEDPDAIRLIVTDHGPGISDETLAHLYDRTWHVKQPSRTGAGLGLAIVRGIAKAHGGRVFVETRPGGPTEVTLLLPQDPTATTIH